jgi:hypothetical protein
LGETSGFGLDLADETATIVDAWVILADEFPPIIRVTSGNIGIIGKYITQYPTSKISVKSNFFGMVSERRQAFVNGLKTAAEAPLNIQTARRALPGEVFEAVNKIKDYRIVINTPSSGNLAYLKGTINGQNIGLDAAGGIKIWKSGPVDLEVEPQIFTASEVGWKRNTDSEYKMLNKSAADLGGQTNQVYPAVTGTLYIISERPYCLSCQGVIQQYNQMFPNVNLILIDGVK